MSRHAPKNRPPAPHRLVARLVPDPSAPPPLMVVAGLTGASTAPGVQRIYLHAAGGDFVEFARADVLHEEHLGSEPQHVVWLPRSAQIRRGRAQRRSAEGAFLSGDITRSLLPRLPAAALTPAALWARPYTAYSCYHQCPSGATACAPVLCTLPGIGCAVSQRPDVCV